MSADTPLLRPLSVGDILDHAIRIYRRNFAPLVLIVAIISLPYTAIQFVLTLLTNPFLFGVARNVSPIPSSELNTSLALAGQLVGLLLTLVYVFAAIFQSGALTAFVSEKFLGRAITVRQAYGRALQHWLALLIATVLLTFVFIALFGALCGLWVVPLLGIGALSSTLESESSAALGLFSLLFCCLLLPMLSIGVFFSVRWTLFVQAIVLENYNSTGGLGRSWKLGKGSFWRILFVLAALTLLVLGLNLGFYLLALTLATALQSPLLIAVFATVSLQLVNILVTPLQFSVLTILYYDLRVRKEGFDLQMQMQRLPDAPLALGSAPAHETPTAPPQSSNASSLDLPSLYSRDDYLPK
ncbi:MAG: hypothetical protein BroJett039_02190 [Chloroflexota bacterium]|nr:MAG: hypothetical protein BroJett039_02190 [Chloroflexota bacterium]